MFIPFYCGTFMADMVDPKTPPHPHHWSWIQPPTPITGREWVSNRGTLDNSPPVW